MKIGFFGGCFNPPTNVHIDIAKELVKNRIVEKVIFVPIGDFYKKQNLVSIDKRIKMLQLAIDKYKGLEIDGFEKNIKQTIFAADAFKMIYEKYKEHEIYFIMGSDNFSKMSTWNKYNEIIDKYNYIVVERDINKVTDNRSNIVIYSPKKKYNYDSTTIRKMIKEQKNMDNMLNIKVIEYIRHNKLYL